MDLVEECIGTKLDLLTDLYKTCVSKRISMIGHLSYDFSPFSFYLQVSDHCLLPNVVTIVVQMVAVYEIHCSFTEFIHSCMFLSSINIRIQGQKGMSDDINQFYDKIRLEATMPIPSLFLPAH